MVVCGHEGGAAMTTRTADEVVHEYPAVGKYRVRVLKKGSGTCLDVREYVSSEKFEGFTRRGVRLDGAELASLEADIKDALARGWFGVKSPGPVAAEATPGASPG